MGRSLSDVVGSADSLGAALVALTREFPALTVEDLIAAERTEIVDLGWVPSSRHRDCSHLLTMAEMLRPVAGEHRGLTVANAFKLLVDRGHCQNREIAKALSSTAG